MKIAAVVTVAVVVSALAAGCGSVRAPGHSVAASRHPALVTAGPPTAAGNRKLAAGQAAWLLSLAPVPAGAVALRQPPASMTIPAGPPGIQSFVSTSRSWRLAMTASQALAWLRTHRPRGLTPGDGLDSVGGGGLVTTYVYSYYGHSGPAWASAELDVDVADAGGAGSVLRADAVVVWLDPVPVPDNNPGARVHLSVTADCPATDQSVVGVTNSGAGLRTRLLPAGAPAAGLECGYGGLRGNAFGLRSQIRLTAAAASKLARSMQQVPLSHFVGGITGCPANGGGTEVIALSYPGRPAVDLWVVTGGCGFAANGFIETSP